jgi:hypothetical protein
MAILPRVFVSATSTDLKSFRQAVRDVLLTLDVQPVLQDHFPPEYRTVVEMLRNKILDCDAVVCLVGLVYGAEPLDRPAEQPRRSYTQLEFDMARQLGKPVYVFLADESCNFDRAAEESDELQNLQRAYREELRGLPELWHPFSSKTDLLLRIAQVRFVASLEDLLPTLPSTADLAPYLAHFTGRHWVFGAIHEWLGDPRASRLFWIRGLPGAGKSAIAAWLCCWHPHVVGFHFCRHGDPMSTDPRRCVQSIAHQLSTKLPDYRKSLKAVKNLSSLIEKAAAQDLFHELIVRPLAPQPAPSDGKVMIVIDALDEVTHGPENELAELLARKFEWTPDWLRLVITSRPDPEVTHPLQGLRPFVLETASRENEEDIREYLRRELGPLTGGAGVPPEIIDTLVERSEGIFLYIHLIHQELETGRLPLDRVQEFPQGLGRAYAQFFKRRFPDVRAYEDQVEPVLGVVAAAYGESLPEGILTAIFGWDDKRRNKFFDSLGSLFLRVRGWVRPFHLSIRDWLVAEGEHGGGPYSVSLQAGHQRLAKYCWAECARHVSEDKRLSRDQFRLYGFRYGVRHLVVSRGYGRAVKLLDYLVRHEDDYPVRHEQALSPDDRADLDQLAKLITVALDRFPPSESEARRIAPHKLARLLQGLYMSAALDGGIRVLVERREAWPGILEKLLATDDFVLRETIADVLAEGYLESRQRSRLEDILKLLEHPDINHQELGSYALGHVYAGDPTCIEPKYLNLLADGEAYFFRSALGDLLLSLAVQDWGGDKIEHLETINLVAPSSRFWNPIWDLNRMHVTWLQAVNYFVRRQAPPPDVPDPVREAHQALVWTEGRRQELLRRPVIEPLAIMYNPLDYYYHLGVKRKQIRDAQPALKANLGLKDVCEVLFAHPLWKVTETAAELLASIAAQKPEAHQIIVALFDHKLWRVQYGAAEAAFLARFTDRNQRFRMAVDRFSQHPEPLLRGNSAENLAAWILESSRSEREALLKEEYVRTPLRHWLQNEAEDCWVLDNVYRLFRRLASEGHENACQKLLDGGVSWLLEGEPKWYSLDRQSFLRRLEERKRQRSAPAR